MNFRASPTQVNSQTLQTACCGILLHDAHETSIRGSSMDVEWGSLGDGCDAAETLAPTHRESIPAFILQDWQS